MRRRARISAPLARAGMELSMQDLTDRVPGSLARVLGRLTPTSQIPGSPPGLATAGAAQGDSNGLALTAPGAVDLAATDVIEPDQPPGFPPDRPAPFTVLETAPWLAAVTMAPAAGKHPQTGPWERL